MLISRWRSPSLFSSPLYYSNTLLHCSTSTNCPLIQLIPSINYCLKKNTAVPCTPKFSKLPRMSSSSPTIITLNTSANTRGHSAKIVKNRCRLDLRLFSERELTFTFAIGLCYRPSVCLSVFLSSVCDIGAPYSNGWNFRQFFFAIWYLGHPLTFTENFTEIVKGESLRRGI